jgi:hypothetical protein
VEELFLEPSRLVLDLSYLLGPTVQHLMQQQQ